MFPPLRSTGQRRYVVGVVRGEQVNGKAPHEFNEVYNLQNKRDAIQLTTINMSIT
jgi:hypothetical protein